MKDFLRPKNLGEALGARQAHPNYLVLAGGTDLYVASKDRPAPEGTIDIFGLEELRQVSMIEGGGYRIGSGTTYQQIIDHAELGERYPMLIDSSREVGASQIQARGTIGGNICTSSPVGDTLPVWLALDAKVELSKEGGVRTLDYADFLTGYRETALARDELVTAILLPELASGARQVWRKVGTRRAQSISKVMMAALTRVEGGVFSDFRVALGAVADRTIRVNEVESLAKGKAPSVELARELREAMRKSIQPISDVRSTADYRWKVAENLVARLVTDELEAS